jgi:hypothetical protein
VFDIADFCRVQGWMVRQNTGARGAGYAKGSELPHEAATCIDPGQASGYQYEEHPIGHRLRGKYECRRVEGSVCIRDLVCRD